MKRLAYMLGTFPALTETFVLGEIRALRARGVDPQLFALRRPEGVHRTSGGEDLAAMTVYGSSVFRGRTWAANLRVLRRSAGRYVRVLASVLARTVANPVHCLKTLAIFPVAVAFAEVIRERRIEHVHAHWATYPTTAAYIISRLLDIPYSFTAHVNDATLIRAMMREKMRRAAFIVTCTRWNRRLLAALAPETEAKILVNYHGIFLDTFVSNGSPALSNPDKFVILSCGSLYPRKGVPDLLEACRLLRDRGWKFDCTIIGEGPLRPQLERLIRTHRLGDSVHLAGALPHNEVIQHYRLADLFVLPCATDYLGWAELFTEPVKLLEVGLAIPFRPITDGIPNVLVEAMAMGVPVVSTTVAGIPELIENDRTGMLVPEKNPAALAAAIERLLQNPHERLELAGRARAVVRQRFDRLTNTRELVALFANSLAEN